MAKSCFHCQKLQQLYPEREYNPKTHIKAMCPILAETKCYNCDEIGHTPKYCKMPKIKCTHCGRFGHTSELCENQQNDHKEVEINTGPLSWVILNQKEMDFTLNIV